MKWYPLFLLGSMILLLSTILLSFKLTKDSTILYFIPTTYYYECQACSQKITPGFFEQEDCRENSLNQKTLTNISNWITSSSSSIVSPEAGNYISAISFNAETTADGGDDGKLTIQEALNALWDYYVSQTPQDLPSNSTSITVGICGITVYRKTATCR